MDRTNHYECAFESYLQTHRLAYVAVDETRRAVLDGDLAVKSLDFIVYAKHARLVIDVKGRRFPGGPPKRPRRIWETWSFRDDIDGLDRWAEMAGTDYQGLLVFAYCLHSSVEMPATTADLFLCRGKRYLFRAVCAREYRKHMRMRSPSWDTVNLPRDVFRALVRPFSDFLRCRVPEEMLS